MYNVLSCHVEWHWNSATTERLSQNKTLLVTKPCCLHVLFPVSAAVAHWDDVCGLLNMMLLPIRAAQLIEFDFRVNVGFQRSQKKQHNRLKQLFYHSQFRKNTLIWSCVLMPRMLLFLLKGQNSPSASATVIEASCVCGIQKFSMSQNCGTSATASARGVKKNYDVYH